MSLKNPEEIKEAIGEVPQSPTSMIGDPISQTHEGVADINPGVAVDLSSTLVAAVTPGMPQGKAQ